jgi:hypothetical protein
LFDDTTNSYKLLFFRSMLQMIGQDQVQSDRSIDLSEIVVKMLVNAWQISEYYKLSLGSRDSIVSIISRLKVDFLGVSLTTAAFSRHLENEISNAYEKHDLGSLLRYVPYRLLRPFFAMQIKRLPDHKVNKAIQDCAIKASDSRCPSPYTIHDSNIPFIRIDERWLEYFKSHLKILSDWTDWHLASYLQDRNPNSPSVIKKLSLPTVRKSLLPFHKIWLPLIKNEGLKCIYSNQSIQENQLNLDHFLPWSFVCHDEPWNLIPVSKMANSSKGNCIPSENYLPSFVSHQFRALSQSMRHLKEPEWRKVSMAYSMALRIPEQDLLDVQLLYRAYEETLLPMVAIASRMGFESDWKFSNEYSK